ncbi:serine hydrolase [Lacrimispora sp. 210928-DFI.3.58]|uniref:serine hydrolase n=1 Tax=Lacrimispora sp. 210928-DFI.3.58 TaxID=2883214 RepID=UPI001D0669F4|nr:D-alanyl-D-alanine carboxypeptidase family protein [Lacrimispora sp. 210928-DFI.3.58]MCB7318379.1 serine hydrolase [Lacrimispora sp. 210928-DFI.3.58]
MKWKKWKPFLCISTAAVLAFSTAAYGSQITITPLDQAGSTVSPGGAGEGVSSEGPGGTSSSAGAGVSPSGGSGAGTAGISPSGNAGSGTAANSQPGTAGTGLGGADTAGTAAGSEISQPAIEAEGAVLMDSATGAVLYAKNGETQFYPASITKLMTALLVAEKCSLDDTVTFSATATTNLESGAVSIKMAEGDTMTVRECLYALLLKSANEVGNALAEHVAGSNGAFADMMNAKAVSLGCTNTHFTNPHGLNDEQHYTTPHDMALIARAAFQNDTVKTVASTRTYTLPATKNNPSGLTVTIGHKMLNPNDSRYYPGIIGGKTGYTSKAGNTLVTAAEKDGVRLIAVIMKSKSTHYTDTKALFDYGFELAAANGISGAGSAGTGTGAAGTGATGTAAAGTAGASTVTGTAGTAGDPGVSSARGWVKDGDKWHYIKDNGTKASNEWISADGESYWFDADGYMAKGWRQVGGTWYYLRSNGAMAKNYWAQVQETGKWFYLGSDGAMLTNTTTPDGCKVGADGSWVQ